MPENKYSPPEDRFAARRNVCRMAEPLSAGVTGCVRTVFLKAVAAPRRWTTCLIAACLLHGGVIASERTPDV